MKRLTDNISNRRAYIKERMSNKQTSVSSEVRKIARDLFISERTVYRDLHA